MASSDADRVKILESENEQLKDQLKSKEATLIDLKEKATLAINKLKAEIKSLKENQIPCSEGSEASQNIQDIVKARDEALEEVNKVKEQAKKHLIKIKTQHQEELNALRESLQNSGESKSSPNGSDQEAAALKEELAKVNMV